MNTKKELAKKEAPKKSALSHLLLFLEVNFVFTLLICAQYIYFGKESLNMASFSYLIIALFSNTAMLYIIIALPLALIATIPLLRKLYYVITPAIMVIFNFLLFADTTIYRFFKFHCNSMVLNLFLTEGASDSVKLGGTTFATISGIIILVLFIEYYISKNLFRRLERGQLVITKKRFYHVGLIILSLVFLDKGTYAISDLKNVNLITRYNKLFPFYQTLTIKRFMKKTFGYEMETHNFKISASKHSRINYPTEPIQWSSELKKPHIIMLIVDSWRFDMLTEDVTPEMYKFSKKCLNFTNHYSGGNSTRFGIFSILYGIYGSYWHSFLAERKSPVFIDELIKQDYRFRILSGTKLTYPEFRKTAFKDIQDSITDEFDGVKGADRDAWLTKELIRFLKEEKTKGPTYSFVFYDAPHGPYKFPKSFNRFKPSKDYLNYLTITKKNIPIIKNSYKNALYFDDSLCGKVVDFVTQDPDLKDNTIIIITGDHGEEFFEHGYYGHTSAFTDYQVKVPFLMYVPGKEAKELNYLTSHHDIVPTLFDYMGSQTSPTHYSSGFNLFHSEDNRDSFTVSSGWDDASIIDGSHFLIYSTESYNSFRFEIRNKNYDFEDSYKKVLQQKRPSIGKVLKEMGKFLK